MALNQKNKAQIVARFGKNAKDTGATEVQIALLTARISYLTTHLQANKKDYASKRGLFKLVSQRRRLLKYLEANNIESYRNLLQELKLRK